MIKILLTFGVLVLLSNLGLAMPPHKPGSGVKVVSDSEIIANAGVAKSINVSFSPIPSGSSIKLTASLSKGLSLESGGELVWHFSEGDTPEVALKVLAPENGVYYIMFTAFQEVGNDTLHTVSGIAVQVGPKVRIEKTAKPGGIKELPAQETIQ